MDYNNNIIYKIVCNDLNVNQCYVGHTTDMTKRKCQHKSCCHNEKNKHHNLKIYQIIREHGGWSNWSMVLVEKFPCKDKQEACKREREIFEELGAKMNTLRPYRTQEELKEELKQKHKKYCEEHYQENKQYHKQYREDHKAEYKEYREKHKTEYKEYQKQYREDHKEYYKQYREQYREENKAEINEKIECEYCSKLLSKQNMSRHHTTCKSKE